MALGDIVRLETENRVYRVRPETEVWVMGDDMYVSKKARDVNKNDILLERFDCSEMRLFEIKERLAKNFPEYKKAQETVLSFNSEGNEIPRLRQLLLEGLTQNGLTDIVYDEDKVFLEGDDYSDGDYRIFRSVIVDLLPRKIVDAKKKPLVTEETVSRWLKGKTLMPQDKRALKALATTHQEFGEIYETYDEYGGFRFQYECYVYAHQRVVPEFAHLIRDEDLVTTQKHAQDDTRVPRKYRLTLRKKVQALRESLERDVLFSPVLDTRVEKKGAQRNIALLGTPTEEQRESISFSRIIDMHNLLYGLFVDGLERYVRALAEGEHLKKHGARTGRIRPTNKKPGPWALARFVEVVDHELDPDRPAARYDRSSFGRKQQGLLDALHETTGIKQMADIFVNALDRFSVVIDDLCGVGEGTFEPLHTNLLTLRRLIPAAYHKVLSLEKAASHLLGAQGVSMEETERVIRLCEGKRRQHLSYLHDHYDVVEPPKKLLLTILREMHSPKEALPSDRRTILRLKKRADQKAFSQREAKRILRELSMPDALALADKRNWYWGIAL